MVVAAAAHNAGVGGTFWTTDLAVVNSDDSPAMYRLELLDGSVHESPVYSLSRGSSARHRDVVAAVFAGA